MLIIKKLSNMIEEELNDAEKYARCALNYKDDPVLGDMFYELSRSEEKHYMMLHDQGVRLIADYKAEGKTVPEAMQAVYDYLHERHIEHAMEIKMLQEEYKADR